MAHRQKRGHSNHWYGMLAYLVIGALGLAYVIFQYNEIGAIAGTAMLTMLLLALILGGLATYPMLFKDSMYLSRSGYPWTPRWWAYAFAGLGIPILVYFVGDALSPLLENGAVALLSYTVLTILVNAVYLYRRHKYIGRP